MTNIVAIDVEALVNEVSDLVSMPEIYLKIRELMDDPESCLNDFALIVNTDPGLTASVLKIVNSAFFGLSKQIESINRALNLLGIGQLHDLVLSLSTINNLEIPNEIEELSLFWRRSIYCGVLSRLIAKKQNLQNAESLFIVGLLHEIGRLILFLKYPKEANLAVFQAEKENLSLNTVEKNIFGTDYGKIGQALMEDWNLPLKFQSITKYHTEPNKATEYIFETTIVHIAHQLSVNKYPGADRFQYQLDQGILIKIKTSEDEVNNLCIDAENMSLEMEKVIFG
ncbi:MAG: HDOD domain-containing protein [Methylococcales bacterium]|nr:HDOD domain-containing protein [Methylococcales bacterium]